MANLITRRCLSCCRGDSSRVPQSPGAFSRCSIAHLQQPRPRASCSPCPRRYTYRVARVQEFLYCNKLSDDPSDHPDTGHVSLVFEHADGAVVHFTRAIVASGRDAALTYASRYTVAERTVTADAFAKHLLDLGINARAKNFLVFQVPALPHSAPPPACAGPPCRAVTRTAAAGGHRKGGAEDAARADAVLRARVGLGRAAGRVRAAGGQGACVPGGERRPRRQEEGAREAQEGPRRGQGRGGALPRTDRRPGARPAAPLVPPPHTPGPQHHKTHATCV